MTTADHLLPVSEVALLLHFDHRTIRRMCESDELMARKIRGRWRIEPASVRALLPNSAIPAATGQEAVA